MFFNLDSVKVDSYPSWSTKIDVEGSIFEKKWRPLPFTLIFSFPQNLVCECWRQTSTPTDPHPPLPLPIHNECLTSWWGGGGREGVSLGWSHKVRGKKWAYRTWGVRQWLRGNRRYRTLYICIQFITILQKPLHPPPLQIADLHPWPSPWERSGGLHISLIFGTASELSAWGIMGIKFCTFWYHIWKKSKVYGRKIRLSTA